MKDDHKLKGDSVRVHYLSHVVEYKSITEFALALSMTTNRIRKILGDKRDLTDEDYEQLIQKSFEPPRQGCLKGESWRKKRKKENL